jgi:hypothetical protein
MYVLNKVCSIYILLKLFMIDFIFTHWVVPNSSYFISRCWKSLTRLTHPFLHFYIHKCSFNVLLNLFLFEIVYDWLIDYFLASSEQYFSISVFQYFSISVFQYFSISVFQLYGNHVFRECHAPCSLKTSFVDFEKRVSTLQPLQ